MTPAQESKINYKEMICNFNMSGVPLPNYLYILDEKIKIHNFFNIFREVHNCSGMTVRQVAKQMGVHEVTFRFYLNGLSKPNFRMLKRMGVIYGVDFLQITFVSNCQFLIKGKVIKLPRKLSKNLAYYIGYLQGDGYLESDKKTIGFVDEYIGQINKINKITREIFGINGKIKKQKSVIAKKYCYQLGINSYIINSFFHDYFGIIRGVKVKLRIPIILFSDEKLLKSYISGLFDADGTFPRHPKKDKQVFLEITMKDKEFMKEIKYLLSYFGITTLKLYKRVARFPTGYGYSTTWEIRIRKKSEILKFMDIIGFKHPDKLRRQKEFLELLETGPLGIEPRFKP